MGIFKGVAKQWQADELLADRYSALHNTVLCIISWTSRILRNLFVAVCSHTNRHQTGSFIWEQISANRFPRVREVQNTVLCIIFCTS
jgi:hypothetical protein